MTILPDAELLSAVAENAKVAQAITVAWFACVVSLGHGLIDCSHVEDNKSNMFLSCMLLRLEFKIVSHS